MVKPSEGRVYGVRSRWEARKWMRVAPAFTAGLGAPNLRRSMMKRTPLFSTNQKLGARLIEFGGWEMPVHYTSIMDEHLTVRKAAGIFDISHMGEVFVEGPGAEGFLNRLLTNDTRKLVPGQGQYTLMCNERGGVIDDLYAYRLAAEGYLLIINASRIEADVVWIGGQMRSPDETGKTTVQNASAENGAVAVQGPRVAEFINQVFPGWSICATAVSPACEFDK